LHTGLIAYLVLLGGWMDNRTLMAGTAEPAASPLRWTNSLGMVFVPLPGTGAWLSLWETRVRDYETFIKSSGYEPESTTAPSASLASGKDWRQPGFAQGPDHPVVYVSWEDAVEFCAWLTKSEQASGKISHPTGYRLPTDEEWSRAVGNGIFPWSDVLSSTTPRGEINRLPAANRNDERRLLPPPPGAGNYAGEESRGQLSHSASTLRNYRDGFVRTAPVGSFATNCHGFFDLGGNVWEWCDDWYRKEMLPRELEQKVPFVNGDGGGQTFKVLRGASWLDSHPAILRSAVRFFEFPDHRSDTIGFRVLLHDYHP
jgi:formylglycine-generating enzyme required for sulfatase activity